MPDLDLNFKVNGTDELEDAADILREIVPNITVRNNQKVNIYLSINNLPQITAEKGKDDETD